MGFFCLGGTSWMIPTGSVVCYAALSLYIILRKKPKRLLIPFVFLLGGFVTALVGPGNAIRETAMGATPTLPIAFIDSFLRAIRFAFGDARYLLFMLLLLPVFWEMYRHCDWQFKYALWVPALSICILAATFFPMVYKSSYWCARHTNACFTVLAVLLPVNLFYGFGWLMRRLGARAGGAVLKGRGLVAGAVAAMLMVGMLSVPNLQFSPLQFSCTLQPASLVMNLVSGEAREYAQWYDRVTADFVKHAGEDYVLREMKVNEFLCPEPLISGNIEWNIGFSQYYGCKSIVYQP